MMTVGIDSLEGPGETSVVGVGPASSILSPVKSSIDKHGGTSECALQTAEQSASGMEDVPLVGSKGGVAGWDGLAANFSTSTDRVGNANSMSDSDATAATENHNHRSGHHHHHHHHHHHKSKKTKKEVHKAEPIPFAEGQQAQKEIGISHAEVASRVVSFVEVKEEKDAEREREEEREREKEHSKRSRLNNLYWNIPKPRAAETFQPKRCQNSNTSANSAFSNGPNLPAADATSASANPSACTNPGASAVSATGAVSVNSASTTVSTTTSDGSESATSTVSGKSNKSTKSTKSNKSNTTAARPAEPVANAEQDKTKPPIEAIKNTGKRSDFWSSAFHYDRVRATSILFQLGLFRLFFNFFQNILLKILQMGPLPEHVSFIMDGNRRYAKALNLPLKRGHEAGSITLFRTLHYCKRAGIKVASAYAFSIENFNRPQSEIDILTDLLSKRLKELATRANNLKDRMYGAKLLVVGQRDLLSPELNKQIAYLEDMTKYNTGFLVYICMPYTTRNDIYHSMCEAIKMVKNNQITSDKINVELLNDSMYLGSSSNKADILVRTSGHTRLSDYMLWQTHESSKVEFATCMWPDFSFRKFFTILLRWSYYTSLQNSRRTQPMSTRTSNYARSYMTEKKRVPVKLESLPPPPQGVSVTERG